MNTIARQDKKNNENSEKLTWKTVKENSCTIMLLLYHVRHNLKTSGCAKSKLGNNILQNSSSKLFFYVVYLFALMSCYM